MDDHKILIVGTGRCGTTFLVKLLTLLGLPTGIKNEKDRWFMTHYQKPTMSNGFATRVDRKTPEGWRPTGIKAEAGLEYHISYEDTIESLRHLPKIIKNPRLATMMGRLVSEDRIKIEHVLVCVRDLKSVAASKLSHSTMDRHRNRTEQDMLEESAIQLGNIVSSLVVSDIPHTFVAFPRMIYDAQYLYRRLQKFVPDKDQFMEAHSRLADHNKVNFS